MDEQVLLLDNGYRPIRVTGWKRAVIMILDERAEVVHETDKEIHSPSITLKVPSVIRLIKAVKIPLKAQIPLNRRSLALRDNNKCQYCGIHATTVDHVIPRSKGGRHSWTNLVMACKKCNEKKRDRLLEEIPDMHLMRKPFMPDRRTWVVIGFAAKSDWQPYLKEINLITT